MRLWRRLFRRRCTHEWRGVANYFDEDARSFIQFSECRKCGEVVIYTA